MIMPEELYYVWSLYLSKFLLRCVHAQLGDLRTFLGGNAWNANVDRALWNKKMPFSNVT